jgi:hypothetical protein
MARRQRGELRPPAEEEGIGTDQECIDFVTDNGGENSINPWAVTLSGRCCQTPQLMPG